MGGKPIEEYAPDFWLISDAKGGKPVGYITSPWYHPEKKQNIAMGYVPYEGHKNAKGFPIGNFGKKYKVHLPKNMLANQLMLRLFRCRLRNLLMLIHVRQKFWLL